MTNKGYKQLHKLRETWEKGSKVLLVLSKILDNYAVIYILIKFQEKENKNAYTIYRYFKNEEKWVVSGYKINVKLEDAIKYMNKEFEDIYDIASEKPKLLKEKKKIENTQT